MRMRIFVSIVGLGLLPTAARADVKPNAICSEGMVLQQKSRRKSGAPPTRGKPSASPSAARPRTPRPTTTATGSWRSTPANAGGPFEMTIKGNNTIAYKNILVGEVWVCSGQSNMEASVGSYIKCDDRPTPPPRRTTRCCAPSTSRGIRKPTPQTETGGNWIEADPKTVGSFTAVGYFFGRNLQENLKVPVGLIHTSWGGTRIETWMSENALAPFEKAAREAKPGNANGASQLYNGMIYPILNYQVKGAIWYQGESNAGNAYKYRAMHPAMIENWRADFKNPDLAFYFVQLAPYRRRRQEARRKQLGGAARGSDHDAQAQEHRHGRHHRLRQRIRHPPDAETPRRRPTRPGGAGHQTYGEKIVYSGPMFKAAKFDGRQGDPDLRPRRRRPGRQGTGPDAGERTRTARRPPGASRMAPTGAPLVGFTICGKDKVFQDAKAEIVGDTVVVSQRRGGRADRRALWLGEPSDLQSLQPRRAAGVAVPHRCEKVTTVAAHVFPGIRRFLPHFGIAADRHFCLKKHEPIADINSGRLYRRYRRVLMSFP